jgi:hypothetical protein
LKKIIDRALIQQGKTKPRLTGHKTGKYSGEENQNGQYPDKQNHGVRFPGGQFPDEQF